MTKRYFVSVLLLLSLVIASCGNGSADASKTGEGMADSTAATPAEAGPDTATSTPADSMATAGTDAAAIKDDSVFNDGTVPSSWQNAGFSNPAMVKQFIVKLQGWVASDNIDSIAAHVALPLKNPPVKDAAQFKAKYGSYFTPEVKESIAAQKLSQVFRNQQGAMIGQGRVWLTEKNNEILIIAINK